MTKSLELAKLTVCLTASLLMASVANSTQVKADSDTSISQTDYEFDDYDDYEVEDEEAPTISGVEDKEYYKTDREITFEDDIALAGIYVNGEAQEFPEGRIASLTISEEGDYDIRVVDTSGNESSVSFVIDKTAPVIKGVKDGKTYGKKRTIKFSDSGSGVEEATYTLKNAGYNEKYREDLNWALDKDSRWTYVIRESNNKKDAKLKNNTTFYKDGDYTLVVMDKAGNTAEVSFSLKDKTDFSVRFLGLNPYKKTFGYKVGTDLKKKDKQVLTTKGDPMAGYGFALDLRGNGKDWQDQLEWVKVGYGKNSYPKKVNTVMGGSFRNEILDFDKSGDEIEAIHEYADGYTAFKGEVGNAAYQSMLFSDVDGGIYDGYKLKNKSAGVGKGYTERGYNGNFAVSGYYTIQFKEKTGHISTYHFRVVNKTKNVNKAKANSEVVQKWTKVWGVVDE